jgi:hypothetical protein
MENASSFVRLEEIHVHLAMCGGAGGAKETHFHPKNVKGLLSTSTTFCHSDPLIPASPKPQELLHVKAIKPDAFSI